MQSVRQLTLLGLLAAGGMLLSAAQLPTSAWATPAPLGQPAVTGWTQVSPGGEHTCALRPNGTLWCWGSNKFGELGIGKGPIHRDAPTRVGTGDNWIDVSAGFDHTCGRHTDGTLWCWGDGEYGMLGVGDHERRYVPTQVGTQTNWTSVIAGGNNTCGLRSDQTLWCWGWNRFGQDGDGTRHGRVHPVQVGSDANWQSVTTGANFACAEKLDSTVWCWGDDSKGQLGDGGKHSEILPVQVGTSTDWVTVRADDSQHACGIRVDGSVWCWGFNASGELGDGTQVNSNVPVQVGDDLTWVTIGVGIGDSCGIRTDGSAWCWGNNAEGTLGDGEAGAPELTPVRVAGGAGWTSVTGGWVHACGLQPDNTLWCWGGNRNGQVGVPGEILYDVPVKVLILS